MTWDRFLGRQRFEFIVLPILDGFHTKVYTHSLPYSFTIAGGRIIGLINFPRVLALCEKYTASLGIKIWVTISISFNGNHYTNIGLYEIFLQNFSLFSLSIDISFFLANIGFNLL